MESSCARVGPLEEYCVFTSQHQSGGLSSDSLYKAVISDSQKHFFFSGGLSFYSQVMLSTANMHKLCHCQIRYHM